MKRIITLKDSEIKNILQNGKVINGKFINFYVLPSNDEKVAFLVNKKVKGAVNRNRAKRKIREAWRKKHNSGFFVHTCVVAKGNISKATFCDIINDIVIFKTTIEKKKHTRQ